MTNPDLPYRELFEANPHPMWVYDRDSLRFLAVNSAAVARYGWSHQEFLAMTIADIRAPEERRKLLETVSATPTGYTRSGTWRHRNKAGDTVLVEVASHSLPFGGLNARLVVAYDVTAREALAAERDAQAAAREEAAAALRMSEERFRLVARATSDAVYDWDLRTDEVWWNDEARVLFGADMGSDESPTGRQTGRDWKARIHPDDVDRVTKGVESVIRGSGNSWSDEYRYRRTDGTYAVVMDRAFVLRDGQGVPVRVVGGMTDLTERRALEEQFLRAQRLESIGTLAGGIAHDLNNMLAPILMSIDLLREHVASSEGTDLLAMIEKSTQRGAHLVREVLTFARGVDGDRVRITAADLVRDIERIAAEELTKAVELRLDVPSGIWAIQGDPSQVRQVLRNLCCNARDAMEKGGTLSIIASNVSLSAAEAALVPDATAGEFVRLSFRDSGPGMPARVLDRVFEPFFTTKGVGKGTGLGLPIVQAVVRSHGGFVTVTSAPGEGSTFDVHVPTYPGVGSPEAQRRRPSGPRSRDDTVLLADDEPNILAFASRLLERRGYSVITVPGGDEAIAAFSACAPKIVLVITDLLMPGTDGRSVIREIRRVAPAVPVIAMSGLDARDVSVDDRHATAGPAPIHLMKPFTAAQLDAAVRRALV